MKILFMGQYYDSTEQSFLMKICKTGVSAAHYKYQSNIVSALENNECNVYQLVTLPVGNFPRKCSKLFFGTKYQKQRTSIGFVNFALLKHAIRYIQAKKHIKRWGKSTKAESERTIIIYDCYIPFLKAASKCKVQDCKIVLIVPDLPGKYCIEYSQYNFLTKIYKTHEYRRLMRLLNGIDGAVVLTEAMAHKLNIYNYIVMEAICDSCVETESNQTSNKIRVLYAGELIKSVGIIELIEAFKLMRDSSEIELIVCGSGELADYIKNEEVKMQNLHFLGFVQHEKMQELLKEVDVFINPRKSLGEYVKYSFPSKNIEYLKTGKPVVAYKLPGIPDEYDDYIIYPEDESIEGLKNAILYAISIINAEERKMKQLEFIRRNKCVDAQGKRLYQFISCLESNK